MIWINGRLSWPMVFAALYSTVAIVATDAAWRLVTAPFAWIAGGGIVALVAGVAAIMLLGARARQR